MFLLLGYVNLKVTLRLEHDSDHGHFILSSPLEEDWSVSTMREPRDCLSPLPVVACPLDSLVWQKISLSEFWECAPLRYAFHS